MPEKRKSRQTIYTCTVCGEEFESNDQKRAHLFDKHNEVVLIKRHGLCLQMEMDENGYFQCVLCEGTAVEGTKAIKQHLKREHGISKVDTKATQLTKEEAFEEAFFNTSKAAKKYLLPIVKGLHLEAKSVKRTKDNNSITYTTFIHNETSNQLEDIPLIDGYSTDLKNLVDPEPEPNLASATLELEEVIENSSYPKLLEKLGPYQEVDHNFIEDINGARMEDGVKLLCGGILSSSQFTLVILAAETYCRDGARDSHAEKSNESYPELLQRQDRFYEKLNICVSTEGDGRNRIKKLLFGFSNFNLLITGSLLLHPKDQAELQFGPSVHPYLAKNEIKLNEAALFLRNSNVDVFNGKTIDEIKPNFSNARQLTSSFDHKSTYFNYRSTIFQAPTRQPATVFTLSKLPTNGYGISSTNTLREVSQFFEFLYDVFHENINAGTIHDVFPGACKNDKLDTIVDELKAEIDLDETFDVLAFAEKKGLSNLAQSLSANISKANNTLAQETKQYLHKLCN